jgi:hypothetical protein
MRNAKKLKREDIPMEESFLTVNDVAKIIDRSGESVRLYGKSGKLPMLRTAGGVRLFRMSDVRIFAEKYLSSEAGAIYLPRRKNLNEFV